MRALLKRVAESTLLAVAKWGADRRLAGRVLVLAYHDIVPRGERPAGDRSLHLAEEAFSLQLDLLGERVDVVPLGQALDSAPGARPRVAITWDDAYQGAMTVGVEQVVRRGLPATVFVAPGMLGGQTFWWDAVAGTSDLDPAVRRAALEEGQGDTDLVRRLATDRGWPWREAPEYARTATETTVRAAAARGIAVGAHSWTHPNLTRIAADRLADELRRSRDWALAAATGVDWVAYPYGLQDDAVRTAAGAAGFAGGLLIEGGWALPGGARLAVPRLNVPAGVSPAGFGLRLAGAVGG